MDPEKLMNEISKELFNEIKAMRHATTPEEKLLHSKSVKNLSESLGVFLSFISDMELYGDADDSIPF